MRRFVLALDSVAALREFGWVRDCDLGAAAALAELAGVSGLRLGLSDELRPVSERDVLELRRSARVLEVRMPASPNLLKVALEARPDRVILAGEAWDGRAAASPIDPRTNSAALSSIVRSLVEAGISVAAVIAPELDAVKAAHNLGVGSIEFFTGAIVDLPESERRTELERLGDAARIASKLRIRGIGIGGGLDFYLTSEVLEAAPVADSVTVGRALIARSLLVGLDRAVRDFHQLLG
jgi:pyridoxine 5-phosphate synthase